MSQSNKPREFYAIYDGMESKLITFVEKERTKKPLMSGGGNLGFITLIAKSDYEDLKNNLDIVTRTQQGQCKLNDEIHEKNEALLKIVKAQTEALEFYGDHKKMNHGMNYADDETAFINEDDFQCINEIEPCDYRDDFYHVHGKKARQALAETAEQLKKLGVEL